MAQDCITIKGTRKGLMIILDVSREFNELRSDLVSKFDNARGFFKGANCALVPTSPLSDAETEELESICRKYGLIPKADIVPGIHRRKKQEPVRDPEPAVQWESMVDELPTVLREGNLRSGQEIVSRGHVMCVGDVNHGAVIKAVGNILVMGTLKGKAHAGIQGDDKVVIIAYRMAPEQISIGQVIARSPGKKSKGSYPEIARLAGDKIIVEPYLKKRP